jgi:VCBS repeat protein/S-layer family protein
MSVRRMTGIVRLGAALAALLLGALPAAAQDALWPDAPWRAFVTGRYPQSFLPGSLAAGDMDGDGDKDVLVGQSFFAGPGVSVLENRGDGSYEAPVYYALAQNQSVAEVALADFDGDGDLDAFATVRGAFDDETRLRVWRNAGDGTLGPSVQFTTGAGPVGLVVADFTGDAKPDVATANFYWSAQSVSLLRHNGASGAGAGFLPRVDIAMGMRAEDLAAADVNGDGHRDLAVGGSQDATHVAYVSILVNDGTGAFAAPVSYEAAPGGFPNQRTRVALADLDNDGDADLISGGVYEDGSVTSGAITIRRNDGQGGFGPHQAIVLDEGFNDPWSLATADLTGDGFADVIASVPTGRATDGYVVLPSDGTGAFGAPAYYEAEQWTYETIAFDADGDGDADVATIGGFSAALTVHPNPGSGDFRVLPRYPVFALTDAVESGDIDNDGDLDIVTNNAVAIISNDAAIVVLKNAGNGDFTFGGTYQYPPPRNFGELKLRDLDGDGFVDLLLAPDDDYPPYNFGTALNNGDGTFAPVVVHAVSTCGQGSIDAFDLDGDGDRDVVLTEEQGCPSVPLPRIFVFRNDGSQGFALARTIVSTQGFPRGMEGADLNGDGKIDLVTALATTMGVFPNNGGFNFGAPILSSISPYRFRLADFDGDGTLDAGMILTDLYQDQVATALGLGGGAFGPPRVQAGSNTAETLRIADDLDVADFDGDGRPDLLTFNYASNDLSVFRSAPSGAPLPQERYGIGNTPIRGTVADFNGDGRPDVAASIGLPPYGLESAVVVLPSRLGNFGLSCDPAALTILAGGDGASTCTVESLNGFAATVTFSCAGLPAGAACAFNPGAVTPTAGGTAASVLAVSVPAGTPAGQYTFQVRGGSGALSHSFAMTLTVTGLPDFSVSCSPSSLTVPRGGEGTSLCTVQSLNAFASPVALSCAGLPAGATCAYSPGSVTPPANGAVTSTLTVAVPVATPAGAYTFGVQGVNGALTRSFTLSLAVVSQAVAPSALAVDTAGNGVLEPNEMAVLAPAWSNTGGAPIALTGVTSGFTGPAGAAYANPDAAASYGVLAAAAQGSCAATGDCYQVAVTAAARPATHWDAAIVETVTPTQALKTWGLHLGDSFTDVPRSSPFYRFVETLLHKDVTGGCAPSSYCPGAPTTRAAMAVFVLVSREPRGYAPPACGASPVFADVPVSSPFCPWVEELARRGIAGGCGGGLYCPAAPATRGQMAVFVLRALDPALAPPACGVPMFPDVPASSPFCRWVEELARRGVVTGCGGGNYCPAAVVTREQMSVFLTATFGLGLYGL